MKKFSKKSVMLFAAAMALCAFAMPSMASASSWGPVGTEHTLHSSNIGFTGAATQTSSMCATATFTVTVTSTANIEIDSAAFTGCTLASPAAGATCTATSTGTNFPWTATARTTSDIQIHGINIDTFNETHPGGGSCGALTGVTLKITGTLAGARWLGNAGARRLELDGSTGLVSHAPAALGGTNSIAVTGTLTDAQETLTVTN
jgi:hypothetical protein